MAFAVFYRYEFTDFPSASSGLSQWLWRVSFLRDGYSGSITTIRPGDNPLEIEIDKQGDSRFAGAMAEKYNFELICDDQLQASQLYVQSDNEVQILIERDTTNTGDSYQVYSQGWLLASEIKEAYEPKPYPVTVSGICGLARLTSRPFLDESGKRLQGFVSLSHAIRLCLYWAGHSTNLYTAFNLYELGDMAVGQTVSGHADPSRCPLYQTLIRSDWFLTDTATPRMCDDVLKNILGPVMRLEQLTGGDWLLLRADEAAGGWDTTNTTTKDTVRVRHYTSSTLSAPPDTGGAASLNLNVYTQAIGALMVEKGTKAYTWKAITKPGVRVEQSFGGWLNRLPNGDFSKFGTDGFPSNWVKFGIDSAHAYPAGAGTEVDPYRLVIEGYALGPDLPSLPSVRNQTIYLQPGTQASIEYTKPLKRTISFKFRLTNQKAVQFFVLANTQEGLFFLESTGSWKKTNIRMSDLTAIQSEYFQVLSGQQQSKPGWGSFSLKTDGIKHVFAISVGFVPGLILDNLDGDGNYIGPKEGLPSYKTEIADVRVIPEIDGVNLNGQQRTLVQYGKTVSETSASLTLGDVPDAASPYDRINTLFNRGIADSPIVTSKWFWPDANILATNPTGHNKGYSWIDWITRSYAQQVIFPSDMVSGNLVGRLAYKAQTVLHLFDVGQVVSGSFVPYPFQITRWRYNVRDCLNDITAQLIPTEQSLSALTQKAEWQTPDGLVLASEGANSDPVSPATSQYQSLNDKIKQISAGVNGIVFPKVSALVPGHVPIDINTILPKVSVLGPGNQVLGTAGPLHRKVFDLSTLFP